MTDVRAANIEITPAIHAGSPAGRAIYVATRRTTTPWAVGSPCGARRKRRRRTNTGSALRRLLQNRAEGIRGQARDNSIPS